LNRYVCVTLRFVTSVVV